MWRRLVALRFLLVVTAAALAQQTPTKPNLTGIWNMDLEKSSFGGLEAPPSARYLIRHLGAKLEMQYEQDGHVTRVDVTPDGEEHVLETVPDTENLARVYWSGAVLVFEGRIKPIGVEQRAAGEVDQPVDAFAGQESADHRSPHRPAEQASADQKVVFEKQVAQPKGQ